MTGEKDKGTSLEKLWTLDDKQLTTPKHDEMVLHILSNGKNILDELEPYSIRISLSLESCGRPWVEDTHIDYFIKKCMDKSSIDSNIIKDIVDKWDEIINVVNKNSKSFDFPPTESLSEIPLKARNGFLIGFLDINLKSKHSIRRYNIMEFDKGYDKYHYEKYDMIQTIEVSSRNIGIEVKPSITSFGQTLRQLNTYREYFDGKMVLYTEDTQFKEAFESQGITVISP